MESGVFMPAVVTERPYRPVPTDPPRKRWTRLECADLEESGLWDRLRLELVEGELISKMGKNRPHTNALIVLQAWLIQVFGVQYVNPETPIDVAPEDNPTNEPQPDLIVLNRPSREIQVNPRPEDLRLIVEISDSSIGFDLTRKAALYARAGIVEYWVLDVQERRLVVHRDPLAGLYRSITVYSEGESVTPLAAPGHEFPVGEAFA
jgi:Uma2 family endonuclease